MPLVCVFFCKRAKFMRDLTWIYAAGLIYSALENLISAFRKTAIVYIP